MNTAPFFTGETDAPEGTFAVWRHAADGVRLRIGDYGRGKSGTVLCLQGRTEYLEKYGPLALRLATADLGMVAVDWRGQGLSDKLLPDPMPGHVERFADYQQDVSALVTYAEEAGHPKPYLLFCHSMGGAIALEALGRGLSVSAAAFSAPMWGLTMSAGLRPLAHIIPFIAKRLGQDRALVPGTGRDSYILGADPADNLLTRDPSMLRWMQTHLRAHPEMALGGPTLRWLGEAQQTCDRLSRGPFPSIPSEVYLGTNERIVSPKRIKSIVSRWPEAQLKVYSQAEHEVLMECPNTRDLVIESLIEHFQRNIAA